MAYAAIDSATDRYLGFYRKPDSIPELDGLRAIAVLLVLARHIVKPLDATSPDFLTAGWYDFATPFLNGWIGVDLFFILSGYLICRHLIPHAAQGQMPRMLPYFSARALRIVPAYLAVIGMVMIGAFPFFSSEVSASSLLVHFLFLQDYLGADIVVAFWSLGVEEKFYIAAPVVVWLAIRSDPKRWRYVFLAALIATPLVLRMLAVLDGVKPENYTAFFPTFRSPFHFTFDGLAIGMLVAFLQVDGVGARMSAVLKQTILWVSLGCLAVLVFGAPMMAEITVFDMTLQPLMIAASFGGIVFATLNRDRGRDHWLGSRLFFIIAVLSYTLYLVHMPLIPFAGVLATALTGTFNPLLFAVYVLVLSLSLSLVIHFAVEKPFLLLKKSLVGRRASSGRKDSD